MKSSARRRVRYAVVGLGHISQVAVLPAFAHAARNSELAVLLSRDERKRSALRRKYNVDVRPYEDFDAVLRSGEVDAVYIAIPNGLHAGYAVRAAQAGVHVLCEKPMAMNARECERMIRAAQDHQVKLMIAYRLHFEEGNLEVVRLARQRKIGDVRFFSSTFSVNVKKGNYRVDPLLGGGTLFDLGVYCVNAARYLFRSEPLEVTAFSANNGDPRFRGVDEMTTAVLRFPGERLAQFTTSFGAADTSAYDLIGTKGVIRMDPAYEYVGKRVMTLTVGDQTKKRAFGPVDQFAPELLYFSDCVLKGKDPEPSGEEGLADIRIVEAIQTAARTGRAIKIHLHPPRRRPDVDQIINRPPVQKPELVATEAAST